MPKISQDSEKITSQPNSASGQVLLQEMEDGVQLLTKLMPLGFASGSFSLRSLVCNGSLVIMNKNTKSLFLKLSRRCVGTTKQWCLQNPRCLNCCSSIGLSS